MSAESKIENALFRFMRANQRVPTRAELVEVAGVRSTDFERVVSKRDIFEMLWGLTSEEQALVLEKMEFYESEGEGPYTLARLTYLVAEVQLNSMKKALDAR